MLALPHAQAGGRIEGRVLYYGAQGLVQALPDLGDEGVAVVADGLKWKPPVFHPTSYESVDTLGCGGFGHRNCVDPTCSVADDREQISITIKQNPLTKENKRL